MNLRDQEPYDDFVRNPDYTLWKGCWQVFWDQIDVVQVDDHTWVAAIPLTQVTCVDGTALQKYIWFFRIHMDDGPPEIIAIALDETTSAS